MKYDVDIKKSDVDFEKSDVDLSGGQEEGGQYPQGGRSPPEKINNGLFRGVLGDIVRF